MRRALPSSTWVRGCGSVHHGQRAQVVALKVGGFGHDIEERSTGGMRPVFKGAALRFRPR
jgi:hypothetical protein